MATNFKNIIGKEVGTSRVAVYTTPAATSSIGVLIKGMPIPPNTAMKPIGKGEKIVLDAGNVLYVTSDTTESLDVILSLVEIV